MNRESREVLLAVKRKYDEAKGAGDKVVVKWLGWLAVFLSMDKEARIRFVASDLQIKLTKARFTKDLYGIRKERAGHTATNIRRTRTGSESSGRVLSKDTSKNKETN